MYGATDREERDTVSDRVISPQDNEALTHTTLSTQPALTQGLGINVLDFCNSIHRNATGTGHHNQTSSIISNPSESPNPLNKLVDLFDLFDLGSLAMSPAGSAAVITKHAPPSEIMVRSGRRSGSTMYRPSR